MSRSVRHLIWRSLSIAGAAALVMGRGACAQPSARQHAPDWSFTLDVGGFVQGNGQAVTNWLRDNAYGVAEPRHCGFDHLFRAACDDAVKYPRTSGAGYVGGLASVRRGFSERWSAELFAATEQSGVATGRCDDQASPKDPRCTSRFIDVPFGGGSFALLAAMTTGPLRLGAGPALLLANWRMKPAHLTGLWVDATVDRGEFPLFVRAQYRIYRSTSLAPEQGFSYFHPSTLFVGLGIVLRANNVGL